MLEKYINLNLYQEDASNNLRKAALILTSFLPLLLLFSRAIADAMVTVIAILFVTHCIKIKNYKIIKEPVILALASLWTWFMISALSSPYDVSTAFLTSLVYLRFVLFFAACISWIFTEIKAMQFAITIMSITVLIAASDALLQFITGFSISGKEQMGGRLTSFLRRPDIGIYLAKLMFPLTAFWITKTISADRKLSLPHCFFLLFFIVTVISLTGERTALAISLIAIGFILFVVGMTNKNLRKYAILSAIYFSILLILGIYNSSFLYQRILDFISDIGNFSNSLYGQLFKASVFSWFSHGVFAGVGVRQFRNACPEFIESGQVTYCDLHSHNIYLEILSESGLIGVSLLCIFVLLCLRQIFRSTISAYKQNTTLFISNLCLVGGLIVILFPVSVTMSFFANWSAILNWVGISLCVAMSRVNHQIAIKA